MIADDDGLVHWTGLNGHKDSIGFEVENGENDRLALYDEGDRLLLSAPCCLLTHSQVKLLAKFLDNWLGRPRLSSPSATSPDER